MKALHLSLVAMAVWPMPAMVVTQRNSQSGRQSGRASQQDNQSTPTASGCTHTMSGKVSQDGKSLVNDSYNKSYSVDNPSALQNYEDQQAAMIVQVAAIPSVLLGESSQQAAKLCRQTMHDRLRLSSALFGKVGMNC